MLNQTVDQCMTKLSSSCFSFSDDVTEDEATWAIATGWLVAPGDIVVTAGHCAYDYSRNLGRLIKVKAYVGYTGKDSIGSDEVAPVVPTRHMHRGYGTAVATTDGWINRAPGKASQDVSFKSSRVPSCPTWLRTITPGNKHQSRKTLRIWEL
jgi:hypothetical protein